MAPSNLAETGPWERERTRGAGNRAQGVLVEAKDHTGEAIQHVVGR